MQRFEAVEFALATRYTSSTFQDADLDAVAHFAARAAVAFGAVGDRGAAAKVFLAKETALYRRRLQAGAARLAVRCDGRQASAPVAMTIIRIVCRSLEARCGVRPSSRQRCSLPVLRAFHASRPRLPELRSLSCVSTAFR